MIYFSGAEPARSIGQCPKCNAQAVTAATLTARFVSLRCSDCGEVWVIPERRQFPREKNRQSLLAKGL